MPCAILDEICTFRFELRMKYLGIILVLYETKQMVSGLTVN
jgi:hypothetical protein